MGPCVSKCRRVISRGNRGKKYGLKYGMMKLRIFLERKKNYMKVRNAFDERNRELSY